MAELKAQTALGALMMPGRYGARGDGEAGVVLTRRDGAGVPKSWRGAARDP